MRVLDTVRHAVGNLRRQRLRTLLTCLGISVGVMTTAIMMSLPAGVRRMLADMLDRQELLTTIVVLDRAFRLPTSINDIRMMRRMDQGKTTPLDDDLIAELKKIDGVVTVYPSINAMLTCEAEEQQVADFEVISGIPQDGITAGFKEAIVAGSWWNADATRGVCALPNSELSKYGFPDAGSAIGKKLLLSELRSFQDYKFDPPLEEDVPAGQLHRAKRPKDLHHIDVTITGVFESEKLGTAGSGLLLPLEQARELALEMRSNPWRLREGRYQQLIVKAVDRQHVDAIREKLTSRSLGTLMSTDLLPYLNVFFGIIEGALGVFGAIALFVAFFGIANTMVMAVLERTREIGILKALGGRDRDVWFSFVVEAGGIGFMGGTVGIVIAYGTGIVLNAIANGIAAKVMKGAMRALEPFYISPTLGAGLIAFATAVAVAAGLYPAWRASRLDPVEALRRE